MTIIKIDKSTIKKNPNAGKTSTQIYSGQTISFNGITTAKEIERLENINGILVESWTVGSGNNQKVSGYLMDMDFSNKLPKGFEVNQQIYHETINHLPISNYSYNFLDTDVVCDNCKNLIHFADIQKETYSNEDDEFEYEVCPICREIDTFQYEFESIEDALKETA